MISRNAALSTASRNAGETVEELLLVNPARKVKKMAKRRTAAQRRATAKLVALNRARRRGSVASKPRRRRNPVTVVNTAPARRRRASVRTIARRVRRRRNPAPAMGGAMSMLQTAFMGAIGATAVSAVSGFLPLPDTLKMGQMKNVTTAALALSLGIFGRRFLGRNAIKMAEGALTVALTDSIKTLATSAGMNLGYYSPAVQMMPAGPMNYGLPAPSAYQNNAYENSGLGEYVS